MTDEQLATIRARIFDAVSVEYRYWDDAENAKMDMMALLDEVERLHAALVVAQGPRCVDCGKPATTSLIVSHDGYRTLRQEPFCADCAKQRRAQP